MTNEEVELVPLEAVDPDEMPTQRFRIEDLEGPARDALLAELRQIGGSTSHDEHAFDGTLEEPVEELATPPRSWDWTPVSSFAAGFGVVALIELAWWWLR